MCFKKKHLLHTLVSLTLMFTLLCGTKSIIAAEETTPTDSTVATDVIKSDGNAPAPTADEENAGNDQGGDQITADDLTALQQQILDDQTMIDSLNQQLAEQTQKSDDLQKQVDDLKKQLDDMKKQSGSKAADVSKPDEKPAEKTDTAKSTDKTDKSDKTDKTDKPADQPSSK